MSTYTILTEVEGYRPLHPERDMIPPLVTMDGDTTAVGTAHGRTVPVIGSTRPPVYDVSVHPFDGSGRRVYADDADDVLAVLCGEDYQRQLGITREALEKSTEAELTTMMAEKPSEEEIQATYDLTLEAQAEIGLLCVIRGTGIQRWRQKAQEIINTQAKQNGRWDALTDKEREVLIDAANPNSDTFPVGIPEPGLIEAPDGRTIEGIRGVWRAHVPLVLNEADFLPWTGQPWPQFEETITTADGEENVAVGTLSNTRVIHCDSAESTLHDLDNLHVLDVTIRPVIPVDDAYRDWAQEKMEDHVAANKAEAERNGN